MNRLNISKLNSNNSASRAGSPYRLCVKLMLMAYLLVVFIYPFSPVHAQTQRMPARQMAASDDTITSVERQTFLRYGVRWLDKSQKFFGATLNISMANAVEAPGWKFNFQFKNQDVGLMEYWGNWQANMLTSNQYEVYPENLEPDQDGVYYFSFNGYFGTDTVSDELLRGLQISAATIYPKTSNPINITSLGSANFYNAPIASGLPTGPFGNFLRSETDSLQRKFITSNRSDANGLSVESATPKPTKPASNTGLYVTSSLLGTFMLIMGVATVMSYRSRKTYRHQLEDKSNEMRNRPVDIKQLPRLDADDSIGGGYAPVVTTRPTRDQLLTIPTNPDRISRRIPMQSIDIQSPITKENPVLFNHQLSPFPRKPSAIKSSSPLSAHHVINEYANNGSHSEMSAILPDDLEEVTVETHSDRMTILPNSLNGSANSRRFLTSDSYPPPPTLSVIHDSYHLDSIYGRKSNGEK